MRPLLASSFLALVLALPGLLGTNITSAGDATLLPAAVTLTASADAFTKQDFPNQNFGSRNSLRVKGSPISTLYVRFKLGQLAGTVDRAILRLYSYRPSAAGFDVRAAADDWKEYRVTFDNAPVTTSGPQFWSGPIGENTWVNLDVTPLVAECSSCSLALTGRDSTELRFASRETGSRAPRLIIRKAPKSRTRTPTATSIPSMTAAPSQTPSAAATATETPSPAGTATATLILPTDTVIPATTATPPFTETWTPLPPTATPSPSPAATDTRTQTATPSLSYTVTMTRAATATGTDSPTPTATPTSTLTPTFAPSATRTATQTPTEIPPTATSTRTSTPAPTAAPAVYWGAYLSGVPWDMTIQDAFEARVGKRASIIHWGQPWIRGGVYQPFYPGDFDRVRNRGSIPMLDWGSWDYALGPIQPNMQLAQIYNGAHDAHIRNWATAAAKWGHPFFLRFDHEMNGWWQFPWAEQINGNQPGDYVKAWRHVHDIFVSVGAANATWVWCPNIVGDGTTPLTSLYPGDAYVDWTCADGYNWGTDGGNVWQNFASVFSRTYNEFQTFAPAKPIMLGEVASSEDGGSKGAWIADMLGEQIPHQFTRIKAIVWFNWNPGAPPPDWRVESSTAATQAFASGIQNPFYAAGSFAGLNASPISSLR